MTDERRRRRHYDHAQADPRHLDVPIEEDLYDPAAEQEGEVVVEAPPVEGAFPDPIEAAFAAPEVPEAVIEPAIEASAAPAAEPIAEADLQALEQAALPPSPAAIPGAVPPPPPPPPPVQGRQPTDLETEVSEHIRGFMANPNPYLEPQIAAAREALEGELANQEDVGRRRIREWAAQRGIIGSSLEAEQMVQLEESLMRARAENEREILEMMANAQFMGATAAGEMGLGLAQFEEAGRQFERQVQVSEEEVRLRAVEIQNQSEQFGERMSFDEAQNLAERELKKEIADEEIRMRALEIQQEALLQGRSLDIQEATAMAQIELGQQELAVRERVAEADIAIQRERMALDERIADKTIAMRAQELQQQAAYQNRSLDIASATQQATAEYQAGSLSVQRERVAADIKMAEAQIGMEQQRIALQAQGLAQQESQFQQSLAAREDEFAQTIGLQKDQFALQQKQLAMQEMATIAGITGMFTDPETGEQSQTFAAVQAGIENDMRSRALDLQKEGMDADAAFRQASLEMQQKQLEAQTTGYYTNEAGEQVATYQREQAEQQAEMAQKQFDAMVSGYYTGVEGEELPTMQRQQLEAELANQLSQLTGTYIDSDGEVHETLAAKNAALQRDLQERALDLQELGMSQDEAYRQAALDLQERQLETQATGYYTDPETGEVVATYQREQGEAAAERDQERIDLQREAMENDAAYRDATLALQEAGQQAQAEQFEKSYAAQLASMMGVYTDENGVEHKTLAAKTAQAELDLRKEALDLQREGMALDDAYRQASLNLQQKQMDMQQAQLMGGYEDPDTGEWVPTWSAQQADQEWAWREKQAETDQQRFDMMYDMYKQMYGIGDRTDAEKQQEIEDKLRAWAKRIFGGGGGGGGTGTQGDASIPPGELDINDVPEPGDLGIADVW